MGTISAFDIEFFGYMTLELDEVIWDKSRIHLEYNHNKSDSMCGKEALGMSLITPIGLSLYTKDLYLVRALNLILLQICGFHEICMKTGGLHTWKPLNQITQEKNFTFIECSGEAMSYEICEIRQIS